MPEYKELANAKELEDKWNSFLKLRDDVLKALEAARNEKIIGKSLAAKVTLYPTDKSKTLLNSISENLNQLFIVSGFEVAGSFGQAPENALKFETSAIVISKAEGEICERCWVVTPEVGAVSEYPTLCPRCADVIKGNYATQS
jgi:isoleucyl-tRNA synthetase